MKKLVSVILILAMAFSLVSCGKKEAKGDVVEVEYFCSVGAYLGKLTEEIDKWNEGEGKEKGVYINLISDIAEYMVHLNSYQSSGKHFALYDPGVASAPAYIEKGNLLDLESVGSEDINKLIEANKQYSREGFNVFGGKTYTLPLEVVPIKMAVNTDLFEKNNLELPKTLADVESSAEVITNNKTDDAFGLGWTNWSSVVNRFLFSAGINSTGRGWWDPNTAKFSFKQYKPMVEAFTRMFEKGLILGADDLDVDQIRAQFAEGKVGMIVAPAYDYAVYTTQFPAKCNWTVIDVPTFEEGEAKYKGVYLDRVGCGIDKVVWDKASEKEKAAIAEAFCFLNSDELKTEICKIGGIIPYNPELSNGVSENKDLGPQWAIFCDIKNYVSIPNSPEYTITVEGDKYEDVINGVIHGYVDFDTVCDELEKRYNDAYKKGIENGIVNTKFYEYECDLSK